MHLYISTGSGDGGNRRAQASGALTPSSSTAAAVQSATVPAAPLDGAGTTAGSISGCAEEPRAGAAGDAPGPAGDAPGPARPAAAAELEAEISWLRREVQQLRVESPNVFWLADEYKRLKAEVARLTAELAEATGRR